MRHTVDHKVLNRTVLAMLLGSMGGGAALAAPPDAGSLLQQQQKTAPSLQRLPAATDVAPARATPAALGNGVKVKIKSINITGAEGLASTQELQTLV